MPDPFTITGDRAAAAAVHKVGERAASLRPTMAQAAAQVARQVTGVPVDTGRLAASIRPLTVTDHGFTVGSAVPYAHYVFKGTRYMPAEPPKLPPNVGVRVAQSISVDITRP